MTPQEAWERVNFESTLTDEVLLLRLQHAIQLSKENRKPITYVAYQTYPEALKRPACVAKLVEWKLQGLI